VPHHPQLTHTVVVVVIRSYTREAAETVFPAVAISQASCLRVIHAQERGCSLLEPGPASSSSLLLLLYPWNGWRDQYLEAHICVVLSTCAAPVHSKPYIWTVRHTNGRIQTARSGRFSTL
jgi:hypothetical protein